VSRHSARLRSLEGKLAPSACPLCAGYPAIAFVTVHGDETPPPAPPPCEACGKLATRFIVHHAAEPIDTPQPAQNQGSNPTLTQQPADTAALDNNRAPETAREPRTRRRRYCGPE
jgi:hypothetical protein